ncbi:hypothetical protein NOVOSPHI9U_10546 [Novosphingobium sp. 9U]|nr:hypothetical protein NOVOSPHI9U_10546 [Novosphingobium sp. 9U]
MLRCSGARKGGGNTLGRRPKRLYDHRAAIGLRFPAFAQEWFDGSDGLRSGADPYTRCDPAARPPAGRGQPHRGHRCRRR